MEAPALGKLCINIWALGTHSGKQDHRQIYRAWMNSSVDNDGIGGLGDSIDRIHLISRVYTTKVGWTYRDHRGRCLCTPV